MPDRQKDDRCVSFKIHMWMPLVYELGVRLQV